MPLPNLPVPLYPDVPNVAGVPPLARNPNSQPDFSEGSSSSPEATDANASPQWGIFKGSAPAIEPTSFVNVIYTKEFRIGDYPVEQGGFQSFNKVARPFDIKITVTKEGTVSERATFLETADTLIKALTLLTVITPEATYPSANLVHVDYDRSVRAGVTLLTVQLFFEEVRVTVNVDFTNTKSDSGASPVNNGTVGPVGLTSSQAAAAAQTPIPVEGS